MTNSEWALPENYEEPQGYKEEKVSRELQTRWLIFPLNYHWATFHVYYKQNSPM
jgi:hypothetical protein